jgi:hypothetical protein
MSKNEPFGVKTYVMTNSEGLVKIGMSRNPSERRFSVQCECGSPIKLEFQTEGWNIEKIVHKELAEFHVIGEWFNCSKELAIERIKVNRDKIKLDLEIALKELGEYESFQITDGLDNIVRSLNKHQMDRVCLSMFLKLVKEAGTLSHLARMLDLPVSTVNGWHRRGKVSKKGAIAVEENPQLSFSAKTLRPDLT